MQIKNFIKYVVCSCFIAGSQTAWAQGSKPSLWCGSANSYYCDKEREIIEQQRQMQQRSSSPTGHQQGQQNMARYWELLQRHREMMERQALRPN